MTIAVGWVRAAEDTAVLLLLLSIVLAGTLLLMSHELLCLWI